MAATAAAAIRRVVVNHHDLLHYVPVQRRPHRIYDRRFLVLRGDEHRDGGAP